MTPIEFHPSALDEAEEAAARYEAIQPGLGREFRLELDAALARISESPQGYGLDVANHRACPLHRFSYTLFYLDLEGRVWVAAVVQQGRRPGYWSRRRPD